MGESKTDALELAYKQLTDELENFQPRRPSAYEPGEVELCKRVTANNLRSAWGMAYESIEEQESEEEGNPKAWLEGNGPRALIRHHLFNGLEDPGPKTKIQINMPTGTAQLLEIWAKREDRTISSCLMEAALRGLSEMKADGHIPAAVIEENEWHIRLAQIHEDIRLSLDKDHPQPTIDF